MKIENRYYSFLWSFMQERGYSLYMHQKQMCAMTPLEYESLKKQQLLHHNQYDQAILAAYTNPVKTEAEMKIRMPRNRGRYFINTQSQIMIEVFLQLYQSSDIKFRQFALTHINLLTHLSLKSYAEKPYNFLRFFKRVKEELGLPDLKNMLAAILSDNTYATQYDINELKALCYFWTDNFGQDFTVNYLVQDFTKQASKINRQEMLESPIRDLLIDLYMGKEELTRFEFLDAVKRYLDSTLEDNYLESVSHTLTFVIDFRKIKAILATPYWRTAHYKQALLNLLKELKKRFSEIILLELDSHMNEEKSHVGYITLIKKSADGINENQIREYIQAYFLFMRQQNVSNLLDLNYEKEGKILINRWFDMYNLEKELRHKDIHKEKVTKI